MRIATVVTFTLAVSTLAATGCATTTKIVSEPPGATVTNLDTKKPVGKTPLTYESKMWMWEAEHLEVKAPNRKPKSVEIKRSEIDGLPLAGGVCATLICCPVGIPLVLAGGWKLPETVKVDLGPESSAMNDEAVAGPVVVMRY
jgi:hypothetical protein